VLYWLLVISYWLLDLLQKSFSSIDETGSPAVPQDLFFLVGWAGEPVLIIFARGLLVIGYSLLIVPKPLL
jgi:hypothetical protein